MFYMFRMKVILQTALLLCLLSPYAFAASEPKLVVYTEHNPPFNFELYDEIVGISTDIFLKMTARADMEFRRCNILLWPWARAYQELQHEPNVILFSAARTPIRENLFQWIGPIYNLECSLVARKDRGVSIENLREDVLKYKIGTVRESAPEQILIAKGIPPAHFQRVHDLDLNVRKLADGRIDALLFNEPAILYGIKRLGLNSDEYEVVHVVFAAPLYYAVSRQTDSAIVNRLQKALDELRSEGVVDAIVEEYR